MDNRRYQGYKEIAIFLFRVTILCQRQRDISRDILKNRELWFSPEGQIFWAGRTAHFRDTPESFKKDVRRVTEGDMKWRGLTRFELKQSHLFERHGITSWPDRRLLT